MDSWILKVVVVLLVLALIKPVGKFLLGLLFRTVFRRFLTGIGEKAMAEQPDRIRLAPLAAGGEKSSEMDALAASLQPLEFREAGVYAIEQMPGTTVRFLVQIQERVVAVIYNHPQAGVFFDLVSSYRDDTSATYSTLPPTGMDARPGNQKVNAPGTSPDDLYRRLLAERPQGDLEEWTVENVARKFEDAYARETAWRKNRGVTAAEVARQIPQALSAESCEVFTERRQYSSGPR